MTDRKIALVTAAAGAGIGGAIAKRLAKEGYEVVLTDAHERRCNETAAKFAEEFGREFSAYEMDVTNLEQVESVFADVKQKFGGLDVLINNAGWSTIADVFDLSADDWRKCVDIDLNGTFYCLQQAMRIMRDSDNGGAIVNLSSIASWEMTDDHGAAYSAAKAGINALTRVAAFEGGPHGIRVNAVAPGLIYNKFLEKVYPQSFFEGYARDRSRVGRVGQSEDVAALVNFLVSDEAGYITGETYGISGGVAPQV